MLERRILFIEPFYGGSHRQVADQLVHRSRHTIELLTLPDRLWKWRRRYAAFELARRLREPAAYDLIVVSDYVDIGDLKALLGPERTVPVYWYCHETQSTYPLPKGRTVEADVIAADVRNALHADSIAFNSGFHRNAFAAVYERHVQELQQWEPEIDLSTGDELAAKSRVVYPGIEPVGVAAHDDAEDPGAANGGPIVVWNHRWEYDKNFAMFARVMRRIAARNVPFRLAVLGENPQAEPKEFLQAQADLADRLVAFGYAQSRSEYRHWLEQSYIVVSTAVQENFGIAVLEAMSAGCIPLLPRRLAYPEILPTEFHDACLFSGDRDLEAKLTRVLAGEPSGFPSSQQVAAVTQAFTWERRIADFDAWLAAESS